MFLVYWMIAVMPLEDHWLWGYELFPGFTVTKGLGVLALLAALVRLASGCGRPGLLNGRHSRWFFLCAMSLAVSVFQSLPGHRVVAFSHVSSVLALYVTVLIFVDSRPRLYWTLLVGIGAAGFVSLYAIRQQQYAPIAGWRTTGMQGDSNYYALLVDLWIPVAFIWAFSRRPKWERLFCFGCLASGLLGVTFAASRGGFLGLAAALLYVIWRSRRRVRNFVIASALMIPLLLGSSSSLLRRLIRPDGSDLFAQEARIIAWKSGLRMIQAHPVTGIGLHNFQSLILDYEDPSWATALTNFGKVTTIAHNTYIELAAEAGVPCLIAFLGTIITAFRLVERVRKRARVSDPHFADVAVGVQAGLISFAVSATFLSAWWQKMFWLLIFLSICIYRLQYSHSQLRRGRDVSMLCLDAVSHQAEVSKLEGNAIRPVDDLQHTHS